MAASGQTIAGRLDRGQEAGGRGQEAVDRRQGAGGRRQECRSEVWSHSLALLTAC